MRQENSRTMCICMCDWEQRLFKREARVASHTCFQGEGERRGGVFYLHVLAVKISVGLCTFEL